MDAIVHPSRNAKMDAGVLSCLEAAGPGKCNATRLRRQGCILTPLADEMIHHLGGHCRATRAPRWSSS